MSKTDTIIAGTGLFLLLLAAFGILWVQEYQGLEDFEFSERDVAMATAGPEAVSSVPTLLMWNVTDNATAAMVTIQIDFAGQAFTGGSATANVVFTDPTGDETTETFAFEIAPGATTASTTSEVTVTWAYTPDDVRTQPSNAPGAMAWDQPLTAEITVDAPGDALPLAQYDFTVSATGTFQVYELGAPSEAGDSADESTE